ncbi:MAG: glycosyltransferase [Chloroflexi bacterium]|nr:glycosyltransferase [Chloroflexota bacterium]
MYKQTHFLLPTIGSAGDVHPVISLGRGLQARGHQVTITTSAYFEPLIRQMGLEFIPLGTAEAYQQAAANPLLWHPTKAFEFTALQFLLPATRTLYAILQAMDPRKTVVIAPSLAFGARLAQEKLGIPMISAHLQAAVLRSVHQAPVNGPVILPDWLPPSLKSLWFRLMDGGVVDPVVLPELNRFRTELGLPPIRRVFHQWMHSTQLVLGLFPDWYAPPQPDWPPHTQLTGFIHFERETERPFPPAIHDFLENGSPPILFTPGSAMQHGARFFQAALEACQLLGRRGLFVSSHAEQMPTNLPDTICCAPYLPFSQVLPRTAALVFHGGVGTMAQGLAAGIPLLVMPMSHDQPDNAARLKRLGVGEYLWPQKFTGTAVARKLDHLLNDTAVAANSRRCAARINFNQALHDSCAAIEQFANNTCR